MRAVTSWVLAATLRRPRPDASTGGRRSGDRCAARRLVQGRERSASRRIGAGPRTGAGALAVRDRRHDLRRRRARPAPPGWIRRCRRQNCWRAPTRGSATGCSKGLRGDFCLILYDPSADDGLIARDHMGGLPVYWQDRGGRRPGGDRAACRARDESRPARARTSPRSAHWISPSGMPADRTLYAGLGRLPAGHLLRLGAGPRPRCERYWTP